MNKKLLILGGIGGIVTSIGLTCAICVSLGLLGGLLGESGPNASRPTRSRPKVVGQDVRVGEVRWKVLEALDLGNRIESVDKFREPLTTSGKFIRVRFEVENLGNDAKTYRGIEIVDRQGRTYTNSSEAFGWIAEDETCILETLNPGIIQICNDIFEVPVEARGLQLSVGNLNMFSSKEAKIDLGL